MNEQFGIDPRVLTDETLLRLLEELEGQAARPLGFGRQEFFDLNPLQEWVHLSGRSIAGELWARGVIAVAQKRVVTVNGEQVAS
jgi:hypothetical protein